MGNGKVFRPKADKKKIHSKNEFELCYLRHQYLRKTTHNPTKDEMQPYMSIAKHMAKNTFFTYRNLFQLVGFESEDLISIATIHLVSFLGLFSLDKMPEKYKDFFAIYKANNSKNPDAEQILNKNKANCTIFLKQRMEDVVRVCRQKARNIKGLPTEEYFFYCGVAKPPKILRNLSESYEKYGYRKLDTAVYKSIRKKAKPDDDRIFRFNGKYYVAVLVAQKILAIEDLNGADMNPYDSIHNMDPEQVLFSMENATDWEKKQEEFDRKSKFSKSNIIKKFIEQNKENKEYKEELRTARKLLKSLERKSV